MGCILKLNQNYNSSRKVFRSAPNGIRACLDFKIFPGEDAPAPPTEMGLYITISVNFWAQAFNRTTQGYTYRERRLSYSDPLAESKP